MTTELRATRVTRPSLLTVGTYRFGGRSWIEAAGEVDAATVEPLHTAFTTAAGERPEILMVDLVAVSFFGSSGLTALIALDAHCVPGTDLWLIPSPTVRRALTVTGLANAFSLHESRAEAIRHLNEHQPHRLG